VAELVHQHFEGHAILHGHGREDADRVHQAGDRAAFLGDLDEHLARGAIVILANVDVALVAGDIELVAQRATVLRQASADRSEFRLGRYFLGLARGVQRLRALAPVAVDGHRLDPEAPRFEVRLHDVLDRGRRGHVDGLGDRPRNERLHRPHHAQVAEVVDGARPLGRLEGAVKHRQVVVPQSGRPLDRVLLVDVLDDRLDVLRLVARRLRACGTVVLTIFNKPPPTSFLYFTSAMSGSTPVVSQSIMKAIVPVGASTVTCELRTPAWRPRL